MIPAPRLTILLLVASLLLTPVIGATATVHSGESIQAAINAATDGDLVIVEPGTYSEPILINRSITLRGENQPVIDARCLLNRDTVTITAPSVTFQGFLVVNSSRSGINISAHNSQIISCEIARHTHSGIAIRTVNGTITRDSIIHDINAGSPGYGIYLSQAGDTWIENVLLQTTNGAGIYLYRSTNVTIENASITGALSNGIAIRMSNRVMLNNSRTISNGNGATTYGVLVENSPATSLTANTITDNWCHGIKLYYADGTTVNETTISGSGVQSICTGTGMIIESTSSALLTRNRILDFATGLQLISSPGATVYQNTFHSLTQPVSVLTSVATWQSPLPVIYTFNGSAFTNITGNSWEGYSGIDPNADGIGDVAYTVISSQQDLAPLVEDGGMYTFPDSDHLITSCTLAGQTDRLAEAGISLDAIPLLLGVDGITALPGQAPDLTVEIGYGNLTIAPREWTSWFLATYLADNGTRDEYHASVTSPTTGVYHLTARANRSGGPSYYCGFNGIQSGSLTTNLGNLTVIDTTPPPCITNLTTLNILPSSLSWSWENPPTADLNHLSIFLNNTFLTNLSPTDARYITDNLTSESCYTFTVECFDAVGNRNLTLVSTTACTLPTPDITPPGSVTNLRCTATYPDSLTWEWDDPPDADLAQVTIYLDGAFRTNVSPGIEIFTISHLQSATPYVIGIQTLDTSGNLNHTWVNLTGTTRHRPSSYHDSGGSSSHTLPPAATITPLPTLPASQELNPTATLPPEPPVTPTLPPITEQSSSLSTPMTSFSSLVPILFLAGAILAIRYFLKKR